MNLRSYRFSQNTNTNFSRFLPSLQRADILTMFCSYFGRDDDFINSFWKNWPLVGRPTGSGLSPTSPFQLVSLHLLSIQFVLAILLAGFMMMFKKKMIGIVDVCFFFGLHCSNFLSQSEICATKHHKIFCTVELPSTMSAIVTEIILDLSFGRCYCCKTFLIPWRLFWVRAAYVSGCSEN